MNQLEKNKLDVDSFQENNKEFIKSNKLILKSLPTLMRLTHMEAIPHNKKILTYLTYTYVYVLKR